jgi:hypothetical protein
LPDVEGGILPPGICAQTCRGLRIFRALEIVVALSAGLEARLYGRQGCPPLQFKLDKFFGSAWLGAMKIPEFKPSKRFLGDYAVPCLIAKVKNSALQGIATRYISQFKKDPTCTIYLRGADSKRVSAWQRETLEQLFEREGLAAAVTEGIKELETKNGTECYSDHTEEHRQSIKEHGHLSYLWVDLIVIDEVERRVMLRPNDVAGPLHEHGATIFLSEGRWRYEDNHFKRRKSAEILPSWAFCCLMRAAHEFCQEEKRIRPAGIAHRRRETRAREETCRHQRQRRTTRRRRAGRGRRSQAV